MEQEIKNGTYTIPEGFTAKIEDGKIVVEKKPSEDERIRTRLIALVEAFGQGTYKDEMLAYLEKQKEQKPAEWSEEDEQWLESIIKDYEDSLTKDKDHAAVIKIKIDFLKSLHPQPKPTCPHYSEGYGCDISPTKSCATCDKNPLPHWKPSEEQIRPLEYAIDYFKKKKNDTTYLESLLNDLKSL